MSSPVRVVLAGAGHLGSYHLDKVVADPRAQLVALVEPDAARALAAQTRLQRLGHPPVPQVAHVAKVAEEADAAIVATPTSTHCSVAMACFARGWHVLVEKPLAPSAAAARELTRVAAAAGRWLQVGHRERFNPAVVAALAVAGRPRYIVCERLSPFSGRATDVDVVLDLMIHDLDLVAAHVGAPLVEARAVGVPVLTHTVDMAAARLAFADGTVAQFSAGRASVAPSRKLRLFGPTGYVSVDCLTRTVHVVRRLPPETPGGYPIIVGEQLQVPNDDALAMQDGAFFACILAGARPQVDGQDGARALALAEAVIQAMDSAAHVGPHGLDMAVVAQGGR